MCFSFFAPFALLSLGAQAAPTKRDNTSSASATSSGQPECNIPTLAELHRAGHYIIARTKSNPRRVQRLAFVQASSQAVASVLGTGTVLELEAAFVLGEATSVIGTSQPQLTAYIDDVNATPVVLVSSVGGPAITLATGTATNGVQTSFAGHTFTAAPQVNLAMPERNARGPWLAAVGVIASSVVLGALSVL